jgi:hypothetical protein
VAPLVDVELETVDELDEEELVAVVILVEVADEVLVVDDVVVLVVCVWVNVVVCDEAVVGVV